MVRRLSQLSTITERGVAATEKREQGNRHEITKGRKHETEGEFGSGRSAAAGLLAGSAGRGE
jgi:hypothetical protein